MPLHYLPKSEQEYLPHNVYMQVVYIIKDYHRMLKERDNILHGTGQRDNQPQSPVNGDPTGSRAVRLASLKNRVEGIDRAIYDTNAKYNEKIKRTDIGGFDALEAFEDYGYFCYMLHDSVKDKQPANITWKRFRAAFAYKIAENLHII